MATIEDPANSTETSPYPNSIPPLASLENVFGIDAAASGAETKHKDKVHVDPYDAAKKLRAAAREAMQLGTDLKYEAVSGVGGDAIAGVKANMFGVVERARIVLANQTALRVQQDERVAQLRSQIPALRAAAQTRRPTDVYKLLHEMEYKLQYLENNNYQCKRNDERMSVRLQAMEQHVGALQGTAQVPEGLVTLHKQTVERINALMEEIHLLAQSVPTVPNMPLADQASQALRAVAAILKANGFINSTALPPGTETWHAPEDHGEVEDDEEFDSDE